MFIYSFHINGDLWRSILFYTIDLPLTSVTRRKATKSILFHIHIMHNTVYNIIHVTCVYIISGAVNSGVFVVAQLINYNVRTAKIRRIRFQNII